MNRDTFEKCLKEDIKEFRLITDTPWVSEGSLVSFREDDGTESPLFYSKDFGGTIWLSLSELEPVLPPVAIPIPIEGAFPPPTFATGGVVVATSDALTPIEDLRKIGEWIETTITETIDGEECKIYMNTCSLCGKSEINLSGKFNYCPHCGAKMRK